MLKPRLLILLATLALGATAAHSWVPSQPLGAAQAVPASAQAAAAPTGTAFVFAIVSDPQIGMVEAGQDRARFERVVADINKQGVGGGYRPEFVLVPGDLVNIPGHPGQVAAFTAVVKTFQMPVHVLPGNHDALPKDEFDERGRFMFDYAGRRFIGVNGNLWSVKGSAAAEQLAWLESGLRTRQPGTQAFVVQHQPLYVDRPDEQDAYTNTPLAWRTRLLELFEAQKVTAVLTGHLHRNVTGNYRGIALLSTPSTSKNFDASPAGYRLIRVDANGFMETYVGVNEE